YFSLLPLVRAFPLIRLSIYRQILAKSQNLIVKILSESFKDDNSTCYSKSKISSIQLCSRNFLRLNLEKILLHRLSLLNGKGFALRWRFLNFAAIIAPLFESKCCVLADVLRFCEGDFTRRFLNFSAVIGTLFKTLHLVPYNFHGGFLSK